MLVPERLRRDGGLCGVSAGEREEDGPHPDGKGGLKNERDHESYGADQGRAHEICHQTFPR